MYLKIFSQTEAFLMFLQIFSIVEVMIYPNRKVPIATYVFALCVISLIVCYFDSCAYSIEKVLLVRTA